MTINAQEYKDFSLRFHEKILGEQRFVKAQIELTYACNLHCVHCYTDPFNKPEILRKQMPTETIFEVLDKLANEGILWLCFTGGEIFMRKDFFQIYDYAYEKGFLITLFTNATLVSDAIADHLKTYPPFALEVTIYGATEETYEKVTQVKGSYRRFIEGINKIVERKLPLRLKTSIMTLNQHELNQMQSFAAQFEVSFKSNCIIYPKLNGDTTSCDYRLTAEQIIELEFQGVDEESCAMEDIHSALDKPRPNLYRCGCGKLNVHIDPFGKVGTCTWARTNRFDFRASDIQEGMKRIAQEINKTLYPDSSACYSCHAARFCDKVAELSAFENGNKYEPVQHFCDLAFGRLEQLTTQAQGAMNGIKQKSEI